MTSIQADGLHLRLQRYSGNEFTSAILSTNGRLDFLGGLFEARIRYPAGTGYWPAFWLLKYGTGPRDELDAMEAYPNPTSWPYPVRYELNTHLVRNGSDTRHNLVVNAGTDLTLGFHTFGMEWRQGLIVGYLDGVEVARVTADVPWGDRMYVLLDFKGGSYHRCLDSTTPNGDMTVAWIRVSP